MLWLMSDILFYVEKSKSFKINLFGKTLKKLKRKYHYKGASKFLNLDDRVKKISMAKKKAFALRINEEMLKAIEKWAADEFRSTNGQIEWMLMQSLKEAKREPKKS